MPYYQHPIKCMNCGLHFLVCSDYKEWPDKGTTRDLMLGEATGLTYCPECGDTSSKLIYEPKEIDGFIFQAVPGESEGAKFSP